MTAPKDAQQAAAEYTDKIAPSLTWSYTHRRHTEASFLAGVEWARSEQPPNSYSGTRPIGAPASPGEVQQPREVSEEMVSAAIAKWLEVLGHENDGFGVKWRASLYGEGRDPMIPLMREILRAALAAEGSDTP